MISNKSYLFWDFFI